jgi:hypothetical protein
MPLESAIEPRTDGRLSWMAAARMGDLSLLEVYFSEGVQARANFFPPPSALPSDGRAVCSPQVNDKEPNGFSPLHIAALYNQVGLVRHLLSIGGDAKSANNWNDTPLHRAASLGYAELCQVLLEAGADPDFEDWRNKTPSDYAKEEVRSRAPRCTACCSRSTLSAVCTRRRSQLKRPAMKVFREWRKKHPPVMPWDTAVPAA